MRVKNLLNESLKYMSENLNISKEKAKEIKALCNYEINPNRYEYVQNWIRQCYNIPSRDEMILLAIDEIIGGYGTEAIQKENEHVDNYHFDIIFTYVNMGDTYIASVFYDTKNNKYFISCLGNLL